MKKLLFTLLSTLILGQAFAQKSCEGFGQFRKGIKTELTSYDHKDKASSVVSQEVTELKTVGGELIATCNVAMKDKNDKPIGEKFTTQLRCKDGNIYMNFKDMIGAGALGQMKDAEMKITGDDLMYPYALSTGQTFPNAKTDMQVLMGGTPLMTMSFTMKDRKVAAKESVTTPAGTFDCYKITYTMESSMAFVGESTGAMWLSDGMMVKTESYNKKGVKSGSTVLTKLTK